MAAPTTTIWDLEPHSRAKHAILKRYLQAWVPILSSSGFPELVYIDGFAGPGRYSQGEEGSPVIALKAALGHHRQRQFNSEMTFLFVEVKQDRADMLQNVLDDINCPQSFTIQVARGLTFEQAITEFVEVKTRNEQRLPPTFAFIDPFGWSGVPFELVRRLLSFPSCEILVTFMYEEINRFLSHPDQVKNFDTLFGTHAWNHAITISNAQERNRILHDLYISQLKESARVKYVRSFEMRNDKNVTDYYLFYATNHLQDLKKMKEAMWKVDESGEFKFSDATDKNQLILFGVDSQFNILESQIVDRFNGQETTIGKIEEFVVAETAFRETHYKRQVLKPLEVRQPPGLTVINPSPNRKRGTYPDKSQKVRFT